jgi:hypothetical protein
VYSSSPDGGRRHHLLARFDALEAGNNARPLRDKWNPETEIRTTKSAENDSLYKGKPAERGVERSGKPVGIDGENANADSILMKQSNTGDRQATGRGGPFATGQTA